MLSNRAYRKSKGQRRSFFTIDKKKVYVLAKTWAYIHVADKDVNDNYLQHRHATFF